MLLMGGPRTAESQTWMYFIHWFLYFYHVQYVKFYLYYIYIYIYTIYLAKNVELKLNKIINVL